MVTFPIPAFNAAVMTMANKVCPTGYDIGEDAPTSLPELNAYIEQNRRIKVDSRNSDRTIFGCPEHNWAFRAWHDWTHWRIGAEFTLQGERAVAARQISDLKLVFGTACPPLWEALILEEVVGQAEHQHRTGEFPRDQLAFAREALGLGSGS